MRQQVLMDGRLVSGWGLVWIMLPWSQIASCTRGLQLTPVPRHGPLRILQPTKKTPCVHGARAEQGRGQITVIYYGILWYIMIYYVILLGALFPHFLVHPLTWNHGLQRKGIATAATLEQPQQLYALLSLSNFVIVNVIRVFSSSFSNLSSPSAVHHHHHHHHHQLHLRSETDHVVPSAPRFQSLEQGLERHQFRMALVRSLK